MTLLPDLSNDTLGEICKYLHFPEIASLYATNQRKLMTKLRFHGVASDVRYAGPFTSQVVRFLMDHTSLTSFDQFERASNTEAQTYEEDRKSQLPLRVLLGMAKQSGSTLRSITLCKCINDFYDCSTFSADATLDTIFPNLKTLKFERSSPPFSDAFLMSQSTRQLFRKLPSSLQTLVLASEHGPFSISSLPSSLTSLEITFPRTMASFAQYKEPYPVLSLLTVLSTVTPALQHLEMFLPTFNRLLDIAVLLRAPHTRFFLN